MLKVFIHRVDRELAIFCESPFEGWFMVSGASVYGENSMDYIFVEERIEECGIP